MEHMVLQEQTVLQVLMEQTELQELMDLQVLMDLQERMELMDLQERMVQVELTELLEHKVYKELQVGVLQCKEKLQQKVNYQQQEILTVMHI